MVVRRIFSRDDTMIVKGVTLLFLLFHHCFLKGRFEEFGVIFFPFPEKYMVILAAFLKICVGMFVFLSGYGMIRSYNHRLKKNPNYTLKEYVVDRYFSLWNKWFFVFLFCQIFCFVASRLQFNVYGKGSYSILYFIIDALGFADFFETPLLIATWWYMSLAFCIILIFPLIVVIYKKIGVYIIPLTLVTYKLVSEIYFPLGRWLFAFVLGIYCADHFIFERLKQKNITNNVAISKLIKFIILTLLFITFIRFRQGKGNYIYYSFNDGFIPMFVIYYCYEFVNDIKYLNNVLKFIGEHSMNIFLTHSFIRATYFEYWTYHFQYWWLIILVLLIESILVSIVIEWLIKTLRYDKLMLSLKKRILSLFSRRREGNLK